MINQKIKELDSLRSMSTSVGCLDYAKERVQTSLPADAPFAKTVDRITDLEKEINREIDKFVDDRHKMINQIQGLQNAKHIEILYKRYVEFKRFEIIAVEMDYTYQYIRELHGYALQEFERAYTNLH